MQGKWRKDYMYVVLILPFDYPESLTTQVSVHPFTDIHTLMAGGFCTKCQPAPQERTHTHSHIDGKVIRRNLGFSITPKGT